MEVTEGLEPLIKETCVCQRTSLFGWDPKAYGECTCRLGELSRLDRSGYAGIDSLALREQPLGRRIT